MIRLLRIEYRKLVYSRSWWLILGLYLLVMILSLINYNHLVSKADGMLQNVPEVDFSLQKIMRFPEIWHNLTYLAGFFKIFPALILIISLSREFTYRTFRQNIIDGLSRQAFMLSKFNLILLLSFLSTLLILIMGLGFGFANGDTENYHRFSEELYYVTAYLVEVFTYLCYAMFLVILVRRTGIAIILLLSIDFFIEPFIGLFLGEPLKDFLPMAAIDGLIRFPLLRYINATASEGFSALKVLIALAYGVLTYILSVAIIQKRNL
jgi:hypothetical protein